MQSTPQLLSQLNTVLTSELTSINQYFLHAPVLGILAGRDIPIAGVADSANSELLRITSEGLINESKRLARRNLERKNQQLKVAV